MDANLITKIFGVGAGDNGDYGYVECELDHKLRRAMAFTPDMTSHVVTAFITAAGHLEDKQALQREKTGEVPTGFSVPIQSIEIAVGKSQGSPDNVIFQLVMANGTVLNYSVSTEQIPRIIGALSIALETQRSQPDQKPN